MGANAQTTVPTFVASQVLTAAQVNQINTGVPVFADSTARTAAFGGSGEKVLAQGQLSYLESDGKIYVYSGTGWVSISSMTNVEAFSASGTFTPPAGVTYAIAHIRGGGGGVGSASAQAQAAQVRLRSQVARLAQQVAHSSNSGGTVRGTRAGATNGGQGAMIMKWLAVAALLTLTACETTRSNSGKVSTRPTYCQPVDRC
jgi:hypothetical protein